MLTGLALCCLANSPINVMDSDILFVCESGDGEAFVLGGIHHGVLSDPEKLSLSKHSPGKPYKFDHDGKNVNHRLHGALRYQQNRKKKL